MFKCVYLIQCIAHICQISVRSICGFHLSVHLIYIYIYISIYLSICRITNCSLKFGGPVDKWLARLATLIVPKSPLLLLVIPVILDFRTSGGSMRTSCLCEAHARIMHEYHESTKMHAIGWNGWNDNEWFSMVQ